MPTPVGPVPVHPEDPHAAWTNAKSHRGNGVVRWSLRRPEEGRYFARCLYKLQENDVATDGRLVDLGGSYTSCEFNAHPHAAPPAGTPSFSCK